MTVPKYRPREFPTPTDRFPRKPLIDGDNVMRWLSVKSLDDVLDLEEDDEVYEDLETIELDSVFFTLEVFGDFINGLSRRYPKLRAIHFDNCQITNDMLDVFGENLVRIGYLVFRGCHLPENIRIKSNAEIGRIQFHSSNDRQKSHSIDIECSNLAMLDLSLAHFACHKMSILCINLQTLHLENLCTKNLKSIDFIEFCPKLNFVLGVEEELRDYIKSMLPSVCVVVDGH
jgi:hypothetical protein